MEQRQHPILTILRWLVFIPGGIIGGGLAGALLFLVFGCGNWLAGMRFDAPISIFMASFGSGYASVAAGTWLAPSQTKTVPTVIVAVVMLLLAGGSILIRINRKEWFRAFEGLCVAVGTVVAMVALIKEAKNEHQ